MSEKKIDVSFVMTVYNKEYYLPSVIRALLAQSGLSNPEFIFVDDYSSDHSVDIIRDMTSGVSNVTIISNSTNRGISARINQGIMLAKGKWTRMLDSDDILPLDSTQKMIALADKHQAEMVYGTFVKTGEEPWKLESRYMDENYEYKYTENALKGVLTGKFTRMGQLIKTSVLKKAGGADERAFIQDESIPLRSAIYANGVIKIDSPVVLVPKELGNFSGNKVQLNYDRYMAYYWTLKDNQDLPMAAKKIMYERSVSAYWKLVRMTTVLPYMHKVFWVYINAKLKHPKPNMAYLDKIYNELIKRNDVRRIKP